MTLEQGYVGGAAMPLIELESLSKSFGAVAALRGVTTAIEGRIIGLLGPNGAGKSTLLKCLLGLVPFQGRAEVFGLSSATHGSAIRDRVGYMPEQEVLLAEMSAVELGTYAAELSGLPRVEAMQRAHAALYYAGIEDKRYQPVETYSTGMKQRVKLACALVHDPELLFLDEPTNGLDPRAREEMLDLIQEMPERRGCAIVLSTHLLGDVDRVCDQVVILDKGQLRFAGDIEALRQRQGGATYLVEVKEGAAGLAAALTAAGAQATASSARLLTVALPAASTRMLFEIAAAESTQVRSLELARESLEQAFLRVIAREGEAG